MRKPYLIAELGVNFYDTAKIENITPLEAAKKYIDKAAVSGIDCVKFQSYKAETLASKNSPAYWDTTKEPTLSQYELFKKFDSFGEKEYKELADYAHSKKLDFTSTPFDYESADYLEPIVDFYKISSSDMSNIPFIRYIAKKGKAIVLSVGASYLEEVHKVYDILVEEGCKDITLMHCVLSYPTNPKDANLNVITTLKKEFPNAKIGFSDHVAPDERMITLTTAYLLGAEVIEKHFTLDKTLQGNDHYHAGAPEDFLLARKNFEYINQITGSPEKTVLECEQIPRKQARRSIVLTKDVVKGEIITEKHITTKRPGTGISPEDYDKVLGCKIKYDLAEDTILQWEMLEKK